MTDKKLDVAYWLIEASKKSNTLHEDQEWLNGDAVTIVIAGRYKKLWLDLPPLLTFLSDTVAPTLVFTFFELSLHLKQQENLRAELEPIDIYDRNALKALPHLNGIIMETLRIHPAVPTGGYRQSPDDGVVIGGQYIPGRTTIVAPRYTLGRCRSFASKSHLLRLNPRQWRAALNKQTLSFQSVGIAGQN